MKNAFRFTKVDVSCTTTRVAGRVLVSEARAIDSQFHAEGMQRMKHFHLESLTIEWSTPCRIGRHDSTLCSKAVTVSVRDVHCGTIVSENSIGSSPSEAPLNSPHPWFLLSDQRLSSLAPFSKPSAPSTPKLCLKGETAWR